MAETPIDIDAEIDRIAGLPNVPVCPICTNLLENADGSYVFVRINPDTRWFYCPDCEAHVGYHRMKGTWKLDPEDYTNNNKLRERIGLPPAGE